VAEMKEVTKIRAVSLVESQVIRLQIVTESTQMSNFAKNCCGIEEKVFEERRPIWQI